MPLPAPASTGVPVRLTVLGGGGFRVPLVHRALLADDAPVHVTELVLHDLDDRRLRTVARVLEQSAERSGRTGPAVRLETDLDAALAGTDAVFSAMRVGGLEGRICDERAALDRGVLGQETTGAGGVTYGLRTVPVALHVARRVAAVAPDAWVINFTNPAGMVTEAMSQVLGDRVVGICDSPVGLCKRVGAALGLDPTRTTFDYAGLNHLGWLRRVVSDGVDRLPELVADPGRLAGIEEGRLFGAEWLGTLGTVPNEYLWYWYNRPEAVAALRRGPTRGEVLREQQQGFWESLGPAGEDPGQADLLAAWERTRREREETYLAEGREAAGAGGRDEADLDGGGYDRVALALLGALVGDHPADLILNVRNRGCLPGLDDDAVVEVPCTVDRAGWRTEPLAPLDRHAQALVATVKAVERTTVEAATSGSHRRAVEALALHPLVGSVAVARGILEEQLASLPELRTVLTG